MVSNGNETKRKGYKNVYFDANTSSILALNNKKQPAIDPDFASFRDKLVAYAERMPHFQGRIFKRIHKTFYMYTGDFRRERKQRYIFITAIFNFATGSR